MKWHRLADWTRIYDLSYTAYKQTKIYFKDGSPSGKRIERTFKANGTKTQAGITILMSNKRIQNTKQSLEKNKYMKI